MFNYSTAIFSWRRGRVTKNAYSAGVLKANELFYDRVCLVRGST